MRWIDYENKKPTDAFPGWEPWTPEQWTAWLSKSAQLLSEITALNNAAETFKVANDCVHAEEILKERNKKIDDNGTHWGELKPWLLALSHGKCWFSDTKDLFSHYEVEHFRPKKEAKNINGTKRDGYWWLAFDYSNYRICGNVGNRKKGGWFPLQNGSHISTHSVQCEESESHYLLDPTDPTDVDLIAYDERGNAIPAPGISEWNCERVNVSIERLKLNAHEALTEARRELWQSLTVEIEKYLSAKSKSDSGRNPGALGKFREHSRNIREMLKPEAPLSSVAKWCVCFRDEQSLFRL